MSDKCLEGMPPYRRNRPDITFDSPCQVPCDPVCCDDCPCPPPPRTAEELLRLAQDVAARKNSPEYMLFLKEYVR